MDVETFEEALDKVPLYLDGSDGSMWNARATFSELNATPESAVRYFIRVSDLKQLIEQLKQL